MYKHMSQRRTIDIVCTEDVTLDDRSLLCRINSIIQVNQHVTAHIGSNTRIIAFSSLTSGTTEDITCHGTARQQHLRITIHISHIASTIEIIAYGTALHLDLSVLLHKTGFTTAEDIALDVGTTTDGDICPDRSRETIA